MTNLTCHNDRLPKPYLIGIAGLSGSGKTALARRLADALDRCEILSLDSYYLPQSHIPLDARAALNFDHPDALDWPLLHDHLRALASGHSIDEPQYLFDQHTRASETRRIDVTPFLIIEGILTLHRPEVRALLNLKVFVATRGEECLRRRLARDIAERGRTPESVRGQYEKTVWPMAVAYVLPTRQVADIVVGGEEPIETSVGQILQHIRVNPRSFAAINSA